MVGVPVSLVQYQVRAPPKVRLSHFQKVNETSRCCNDNLNPIFQVT
jgi:hypothetical protein